MALDHYVSQVHLKRFYSPALRELMYAIRKSDLKQFTPNARAVCRIDEGNTNEYLNEPRAIEEFLKDVEGKYNAAVSSLEGSGKPNPESIYVVAGFTAYVLTCSPAAMRINSVPMKGTLEATAKLMDKMDAFPQPPETLGGKNVTELLESGKLHFDVDPKYPQAVGIADINQRVTTFGNARWDILINEHKDSPFFTSDFPVAIAPSDDVRVMDRIIPLAPTIAVRIHPDINRSKGEVNFDFRNFSFRRRKVTRQEAIEVNRLIVRSAEDAVFFRDAQRWVVPFVTVNRHFRVTGKNVQIPQQKGIMLWYRQDITPFQQPAIKA
jgi:hypothetical protein